MPAWSAKYWFERFAKLPVEVDIASEFRYREAAAAEGRARAVRLAVGRDRRHAGDAALCASSRASTSLAVVNVPDIDHRARKRRRDADPRRTRDRRRLDQGVHLPADGAGLPGDRGRPRPRGVVRRRGERAGARADRGAAATWRTRCAASRRSRRSRRDLVEGAATCSISAAAPAIRWRSKAR